TFDIPLFADTTPKLHLEFGKFDRYAEGAYITADTDRAKSAPRLEGKANKPGVGWIGLNFSFKKLTLDVRRAQVSNLSTLLSTGLRVGDSNFVVGGLSVNSIDESFQQEINNTIDDQIKDALAQGNEEILGGMMKKEWLDEAFRVIFGRR